MTETVRGWVNDLGLGDAVRMHFIPPPELPFFCASSDLAVSLASTDATPASMLECMASRLPLVMGDAITIDEWITQGDGGEVVQCRDEDAVTAALLRLMRDPELRAAYGDRNVRVVAERLPGPPGRHARAGLPGHALGQRPLDLLRVEQLVRGHVAKHAGRHADHELPRRHVGDHDRAGADERLLAHLDAGQEHRRCRRPGRRAARSGPSSGRGGARCGP